MTDHSPANSTVVPFTFQGQPSTARAPSTLRADARDPQAPVDPFLKNVHVDAVFDLAPPGRTGAPQQSESPDRRTVVALEADDGTTVFMRADRLRDELQRVQPQAVRDGTIDLSELRDRKAAARGLGDWIWAKASFLTIGTDELIEKAEAKAKEWLADALGSNLQEKFDLWASWWGAKALMWAIESQLAGAPGLYRWTGGEIAAADRIADANDPRLTGGAADPPLLVLIHGTGSHTRGAFKDLPANGGQQDWRDLRRVFADRIFGFEHRTFSESPIDNALDLARTLPAGARLSIVTHSRGGLVGDLLCLGNLGDDVIREYRREFPAGKRVSDDERAMWDVVAAREQATLTALRNELAAKNFRIERYVRVAAPAHGTRLLSDNLDVFLSGLLSLTTKLIGMVTGPAGSSVLSAFKRIVLEIAHKRIDPQLVPGIEAMHVGAPLGRLLTRATRKQGVQMAVIAGDIEGGNLLKRIGTMFTDWMFFDRYDNDLVVDSASMYGGLAGSAGTRALFDAGPDVDHFSYFENASTRAPLARWLASDAPAGLADFDALEDVYATTGELTARGGEAPDGTRPVVILLPGIMGSHLAIGTESRRHRIWMNPLSLAMGGLADIAYGTRDVSPDGLFAMFYGGLAKHLQATHDVVAFAYDWRRPIAETADALRDEVVDALELTKATNQPVRLLAHSMGGLVCRKMIAAHPEIWARLAERPGARFVMLGTPNQGSHLLVETLLGKSDAIRKLARLDVRHDMQELLDIVAAMPGALQLLPRPQENDLPYFDPALWARLKVANRDFWFGDGVAAVPDGQLLATAASWWTELPDAPPSNPELVAYVFGRAPHTPAGIAMADGDGPPKLLGTSEGDGSVTWKSGRLSGLADDRYWVMPVAHGNLANTDVHFPALTEILHDGTTMRLERPSVSRGAAATYHYDAAPPTYPSDVELAHSVVGARPMQRTTRDKLGAVGVSVVAMDLRFARHPVLCGHYVGDPIAGAEAVIDRELVQSELSKRNALGLHPGEIGTNGIVLLPRTDEEILRGTGRGAVVVGLGEYGQLSPRALTETVRAGMLRLLLFWNDYQRPDQASTASTELRVMSLLLGHNSTTHITVEASVDAVVRGVCEANRQFADAMGANARASIAHLEFLELYLDTAITAAYAVRTLPERFANEIGRLRVALAPDGELHYGEGARQRLFENAGDGYWNRLVITDADRQDEGCPAECFDVRTVTQIPDDVIDRLVKERCPESATEAPRREIDRPHAASVATRIRYLFLSQRARADVTVQQRQPGLVEGLVRAALRSQQFDPATAHTLYRHLLPVDVRSVVTQAERLVVAVDSYTANLPWEMTSHDGVPLAVSKGFIRQLVSTRGRPALRNAVGKNACIIANPSTEGFWEAFPDDRDHTDRRLPSLAGAEAEGETIRSVLERAHYRVTYVPPDREALDVHNKLLAEPYRVLAICAHGVVDCRHRDGRLRTGVVLSDGLLLTAAEMCLMDVVPQLVFLNCCHLGKVDPSSNPNKLAHSLARELIEMGVRCIVVAGWPVNDRAAAVFADAFFRSFVERGMPFGEAVRAARRACYEDDPQLNTWGAYQAYGDPSFVLDPSDARSDGSGARNLVSPDELVERLRQMKGHMPKTLPEGLAKIEQLLARGATSWLDFPMVQYALGDCYAHYGHEGFDRATAAYLRAIAADDVPVRTGVPVRAIEQLANLETRVGGKLADQQRATDLIERGIRRLRGLVSITGETVDADLAEGPRNIERWSLIGAAYKQLAKIKTGTTPSKWSDVEAPLREARNAYRRANEARPESFGAPYPLLNQLQLDGLIGDRGPDVAPLLEAADRAADVARRTYARGGDFFDAVMSADAELAKSLLKGTVSSDRDRLLKAYRDAIKGVRASDRHLDSTIGQLELLARFFACRAASKDAKSRDAAAAATLAHLARELRRDATGEARGADTDEQPPPPPRAARAKRAKEAPGKRK